MNSVRRLTVIGAVVIGTLGLGASTTFAASSYSSPQCADTGTCTTWAPDDAGRTDYHADSGRYQIYDTKSDNLAVGVLFYDQENNKNSYFDVCDNGTTDNCSGQLPSNFRSVTCMKTLAGNGNDSAKYKEGGHRCFRTGPRSEGSPG